MYTLKFGLLLIFCLHLEICRSPGAQNSIYCDLLKTLCSAGAVKKILTTGKINPNTFFTPAENLFITGTNT
jgi:hypothetical protein